jgi:hypothetical protein
MARGIGNCRNRGRGGRSAASTACGRARRAAAEARGQLQAVGSHAPRHPRQTRPQAARLLSADSTGFSGGIVVFTPNLAKEIESHRLIVADASEMDRSLLHVTFTRAMHRLSLVSLGACSPGLPPADDIAT